MLKQQRRDFSAVNCGFVFPSIIAAILILTITGLTFIHMAGVRRIEVHNRLTGAQSLWLAEAGLERAKDILRKDFVLGSGNWSDGQIHTYGVGPDNDNFYVLLNTASLGNGSYRVLLRNIYDGAGGSLEDRITVRSIGMASGSKKTLEAVFETKLINMFNYGSASGADLNIGNGNIVGGGYSGGDAVVGEQGVVEGDLYAEGDCNVSGTVSGEQYPEADPIWFPDVAYEDYKLSAQAGGTYTGNYVLDSNQIIGPLYVAGNLAIGGNATIELSGTIYVEGSISQSGDSEILGKHVIVAVGNVEVAGNSSITDNIPLIVSLTGDITVSGNANLCGVLFAPSGDITVEGNPDIYGGVYAAGSVTMHGNNASIIKTEFSDVENLMFHYPWRILTRSWGIIE